MARTAAVSTETLNHDRGSLQVQTTLIYSFFPFYANNQLHSFIIALTEKSLCLRNAACNSQQGWSLGHCSLQTTAHGLEEPVAFARVKSSSENSAKNKLHEENPIHGDAFSPEACKTNNSSIGALEEHHGCRLPGVTSPGSHRHRSFAHVTRPFATSRPHAAVLAPPRCPIFLDRHFQSSVAVDPDPNLPPDATSGASSAMRRSIGIQSIACVAFAWTLPPPLSGKLSLGRGRNRGRSRGGAWG